MSVVPFQEFNDYLIQDSVNQVLQAHIRYYRLIEPTTNIVLNFEVDGKYFTNNQYVQELGQVIANYSIMIVINTNQGQITP